MLGRQLLITAAFVVTCLDVFVVEGAPACSKVYNPTDDGKLEYVKKNESEWTNRELVEENGKLEVLCEVENFCNLNWYDNVTGKQVEPEDGYIHFERDNQVLVFEEARLEDSRYYTCRASNNKEELEPRTILVQVLEENTGGLNFLTHPQCQNTTDEIGNSVTFYCEYSVGTTRPAYVSTKWKKSLNETSGEFEQVRWLKYVYENDANVTTVYEEVTHTKTEDGIEQNGYIIYNTTLHLWNTSLEAFTLYKLEYDNGAGLEEEHIVSLAQKPEEPVDKADSLIGVVAGIGAVLIVSGLLGIIYYNTELDIKLYWKDNYSKDCKNDKKEIDAYISYSHADESEDDLNFVVNTLKVHLESRGYRVIIRDIHHTPGTCVFDEIVKSLDTSRRCILVISPAYINSWVGTFDVNQMMDQTDNYKQQIVPIVYRDISNTSETNNAKLLKHIMENVKCLTWPDQGLEVKQPDQGSEVKLKGHQPDQGSDVKPEGDQSQVKKSKKMDKKKRTFCKELMLRMPPLHVAKQRPQTYNTTVSQVELLRYEGGQSPITPTSSFQNGFAPIYPSPNPDFSSNNTYVATVSDDRSTVVTSSHGGPTNSMYPVLT